MNWISRIRLRALGYLLAIGLFALGVISLTALPAWPVLGFAVACAAVAVNRLGARLEAPVCLQCGAGLDVRSTSEHGVFCAGCGAVNQPGTGAPLGADRLAGAGLHQSDAEPAGRA